MYNYFIRIKKGANYVQFALIRSSAVDGKSFLDSRNLFYVRLGYVKVPRIEEAFDSKNLLPSTALDPNVVHSLHLSL